MKNDRWTIQDGASEDAFEINDRYFISLINEFLGKGIDFKVYPETGLIVYWSHEPLVETNPDYTVMYL